MNRLYDALPVLAQNLACTWGRISTRASPLHETLSSNAQKLDRKSSRTDRTVARDPMDTFAAPDRGRENERTLLPGSGSDL